MMNEPKKTGLALLIGVILLIVGVFLLVGQKCMLVGHQWKSPTCDTPKVCYVCGESEGFALGHNWTAASCELPVMCSYCGMSSGEPLGHEWTEATFTSPRTCTQCGATSGEAISYKNISVESEVSRIRKLYNKIVSEKVDGAYRKTTLRDGVIAYYDDGELMTVVVHRGTDGIGKYSSTYSRTYYFSDGELFFAFFEGSDSHRLYFYEDMLMRWRYTQSGSKKAVNHDFDFTDDFYKWEQYALEEASTFF